MKANREAISRLAYKLQRQNIVPVWALAREEALYAIAVGKPVAWGPRALRLRRLLKIAEQLFVTDFVLLMTGVWVATKLWWKLRSSVRHNVNAPFADRVFVGFGANAEEKLWENYCSRFDTPPLRMSQSDCQGMSSLGCPSLLRIYSILVKETLGYSGRLRQLADVPVSNQSDFLTAFGMSAGNYAFSLAYWEMASASLLTEVAFLATDTTAFACVDAGLTVLYIQHGLLPLSLLMPKFSRMEVITDDEEAYLRRVNGCSQVVRVPNVERLVGERKNVMLLLSVTEDPRRMDMARRVIAWADGAGVSIIVRPVPHLSGSALLKLKTLLPGVHFDVDADGMSLQQSIIQHKPKFIVAWTSTALATSLSYDCLPISLCDPDRHEGINNMIYPMRHRALFWPRDQHTMDLAVQSERALNHTINTLREYREPISDLIAPEIPPQPA